MNVQITQITDKNYLQIPILCLLRTSSVSKHLVFLEGLSLCLCVFECMNALYLTPIDHTAFLHSSVLTSISHHINKCLNM